MALEYADEKIRVNAICPTGIETENVIAFRKKFIADSKYRMVFLKVFSKYNISVKLSKLRLKPLQVMTRRNVFYRTWLEIQWLHRAMKFLNQKMSLTW